MTESVDIRSADMSPEMQQAATDIAISAVRQFDVEKEMAAFVKKEFDSTFGETWHCIVGKDFGSYVTHVKDGFIYIYVNKLAFELYKTA